MTGGSSITVTLTTLKTNDIIVVAIHNESLNASGSHATVSSVSGGGLTWAKRAGAVLDNAGQNNAYSDFEIWWALAIAALAATVITITLSKSIDDASAVAFGVNGANTSAPWDTNASLPAIATSGAVSTATVTGISTTAVSTMILGIMGTAASSQPTSETIGGSAATIIDKAHESGGTNFSNTVAGQLTVSAGQSSITATFNSADNGWLMIADAIVVAPPPAAVSKAPVAAPTLTGGILDEWVFWDDDYRPLLARDRKHDSEALAAREERLHEIRKVLGIPTKRVLQEIEDKARNERERQAARREEQERKRVQRAIDAALEAIARSDEKAARLEQRALELVTEFVDRMRKKIESDDEELLALIAAWL